MDSAAIHLKQQITHVVRLTSGQRGERHGIDYSNVGPIKSQRFKSLNIGNPTLFAAGVLPKVISASAFVQPRRKVDGIYRMRSSQGHENGNDRHHSSRLTTKACGHPGPACKTAKGSSSVTMRMRQGANAEDGKHSHILPPFTLQSTCRVS